MVSQMHVYPTELQLNKSHSFDTEAFLDLDVYITNGIVSSKIYDKRDDFIFEIVTISISHFLIEMFFSPTFAHIR